MANRNQNGVYHTIDKLVGRENYRSWAISMRALLEVEDLWDTIQVPTGGELSEDPKKRQKARGRIILAIEPEVYAYVENATTPKEAWEELAKTYDDKGLARKVTLLQEATTTKFENCKSMEDYVSKIISAAKKLKTIGTDLADDLVGALLLAGLPASYKPMIMALSNSGVNVTADLVKNKLLEEQEHGNNESDLESRGLFAQSHNARNQHSNGNRWRHTSKQNSQNMRRSSSVRCYNCNKFGHISKGCTAPKRKENNKACKVTTADDDEEDDTVCALLTMLSTHETHTVVTDSLNIKPNYCTLNALKILLAVDLVTDASSADWILDSGASAHMCCSKVNLINVREPRTRSVTAANKSKMPVGAEGDIELQCIGRTKYSKILLKNVLYVPGVTSNLVSVSSVIKQGCHVEFVDSKCRIVNKKGIVVVDGKLCSNNIYKLDVKPDLQTVSSHCVTTALNTTQVPSIQLWHRRMSHLNYEYLKQLRQVTTGIQFSDDRSTKCEICVTGKLVNKPCRPSVNKANRRLELVHTDVCQVEVPSLGQARYFITFLDDYSRKTFVYFLKRKDEVPDIVNKFIKLVNNQTEDRVKIIRSDNGREYVNRELQKTLDKLGIQHQTSVPYVP